MAEEIKKPEGEQSGDQKKAPMPKIEIEMLEDGSVKVNGPMRNEPLCFWLLEMGKDVVKSYNRQPSKLIQPKGGILNFARGKKRF